MPHRYAACWCEENVWQLCGHDDVRHLPRHAVFISNPGRAVPIWGQRASERPDDPVIWDYHVVLVVQEAAGARVWDLDHRAGLSIPVDEWLDQAFVADTAPPALAPRFRVIDADEYRRELTSDRSHMRGPDGRFRAAEPPWPPIVGARPVMNLMDFVDVERPFLGTLVDVVGLRAWVQGRRA